MKKFEEEVKRPVIGIEQSSIKPSLGKAIEFYTDKVKEYHNAFNEMNKYIDGLEAQLDYYKKDKRFEVMAEEILSLKSQLEKQQPEIPEFVAEWIKSQDHNTSNRNGTLVYEHYKKEPENDDYYPVHDWIADHFDEFLQALIYGYTVAKEKRFYLKNKLTGQRLIRLLEENGGGFLECVTSIDKERMQFTQSEIDSMAAESYEQIEVEE